MVRDITRSWRRRTSHKRIKFGLQYVRQMEYSAKYPIISTNFNLQDMNGSNKFLKVLFSHVWSKNFKRIFFRLRYYLPGKLAIFISLSFAISYNLLLLLTNTIILILPSWFISKFWICSKREIFCNCIH